VHSARYAGRHGDDEANNRKLVAELAGATDRFVRYRCAIALAMPGAPARTWSGTFPGEHIPEPRGAGGFGYDPYVLVPDLGRTVAELSAVEKHARSHRGEALRAMAAWLASA
jgi:XTP/dITP diphosphohydrolase